MPGELYLPEKDTTGFEILDPPYRTRKLNFRLKGNKFHRHVRDSIHLEILQAYQETQKLVRSHSPSTHDTATAHPTERQTTY